MTLPVDCRWPGPIPSLGSRREARMMTLLVAPAGGVAGAMGAMALALLAVTALVLLLAHRRTR